GVEAEYLAEIRPFKGIRYNPEKTEGYDAVVAPPYDVISKDEQSALVRRHKFNVVRLILPQDLPGDSLAGNKYTRAASLLKAWLGKGVLAEDDEPSIYLYQQEYDFEGAMKRRTGFIALAKIEDFSSGKIKAHERTLAGPKADRLNLLRATKTNLSQVFSLYSDPEKQTDGLLERVASGPTDAAFSYQGVDQRMWRVSDPAAIQQIAEVMEDKPLFIADGHHRYETALNYRNEMRERTGIKTGDAPFDYVMMMFVNMDSEGLTIFPTHRVLRNLPKINEEKFRLNLEHFFEVTPVDSLDELLRAMSERIDEHAAGAYIGRKSYTLLTVADEAKILDEMEDGHSREWKLLDVAILHDLVMGRVLGLKGTNMENSIKFVVDPREAEKLVTEGSYQAAFFLNPTKISQVKAVANNGETMPQKSTYFYPKLLSGLVFNKLS
ncbi:MAG: DUF1015 domain-containing protein, partial [Chloroflexi bacterium]|nr:DUF1015 domain-containing protein [Chloroflexota bacterium]